VDFLLELRRVKLPPLQQQAVQGFPLELLPLDPREPLDFRSVALQPQHLHWVLFHQIWWPLHLLPQVPHHLDSAEHLHWVLFHQIRWSLLLLPQGALAHFRSVALQPQHLHLEHLAAVNHKGP